jgi:two-component system nitrate/nitrite response regulator NarL
MEPGSTFGCRKGFMPNNKTRIVIADDHPIFRDGLRGLIETDEDFMLAGQATDGEQAAALAKKLKPDVLLLDLMLPKLTGLQVLAQLAGDPGLATMKTILLTAAIDEDQITEALRLGAKGVVLKDTATELLIKSIHCVVDGEYWVGRNNVGGLIQALRMAHTKRPEDSVNKFSLTARELEIVTAIVEGYSNKEIARKFSISEQTVKHHLSSIFDKVGVSNRLELALFSVNHQLVGKRT